MRFSWHLLLVCITAVNSVFLNLFICFTAVNSVLVNNNILKLRNMPKVSETSMEDGGFIAENRHSIILLSFYTIFTFYSFFFQRIQP